jgi:hypothetical protein
MGQRTSMGPCVGHRAGLSFKCTPGVQPSWLAGLEHKGKDHVPDEGRIHKGHAQDAAVGHPPQLVRDPAPWAASIGRVVQDQSVLAIDERGAATQLSAPIQI